MDIETIKGELKKSLSPKRYNHSILVAEKAKSLAKHYHINEEKAYITGLIHDIAKELTEEENIYWIEKGKLSKDLENKEQDFLTALDERTQLQSKRQTGIIKETRMASDNAYRELIYTVNASILINGKEPYSVFVNNTNVFIKNMKTTLKARATINAKKEKRGKSKGNTPVTKK